jgi:hypothetical protein
MILGELAKQIDIKDRTPNFFPSSFFAVVGAGIRDKHSGVRNIGENYVRMSKISGFEILFGTRRPSRCDTATFRILNNRLSKATSFSRP